MVIGIDQDVEETGKVLSLEREHVEHMRIHPVIGVRHRFLPELFPFWGESFRLPLVLMRRGIDLKQKAEEMDHAAGIFITKAARLSVGAARIERKNRFQMRRMQVRGHELLGAEAGNADHSDIFIAPGLRRNPFDQIIAVEGTRTAALGFTDAARISDHMHIASRYKETRVACFRGAGPEHGPGRLRQNVLCNLRTLQILVVDRKCEQRRQPLTRLWPIDIDRNLDAVAHRNENIFICDHALMDRPPIIIDRSTLAREREVK